MRKIVLLLTIFISFLYLFPQNAVSFELAPVCDSRPNSVLSGCSECAKTCDYTAGLVSPCKASDCPAGTVLVDCYPANILFFTVGYRLNCLNLRCGDAGVVSGNTCVMQSSLDSNCVDAASTSYSWTDNYGSSAPTLQDACKCYSTTATFVNQYNKKADGTTCITKDWKTGTCQSGKCNPGPTSTACPDGTLENACCNTPGTRCNKDASSNLVCQNDASCPLCTDTDGGKVPGTKGTCKDVSGGVCDWRKGGCTDTCASNGAVNEYYCPSASSACMPATMPCSSSDVCQYGACGYTSGGGGGTGGTNPGSGGCSWSRYFYDPSQGKDVLVCSSGCPTSYPNQQYTCCASAGGGCNPGTSGCASYDPIQGQTPCCTSGGYYTCNKQEICTQSGCQNVCTGADKTSDLYCSKCSSCQDGIQNCGETAVDAGGPNCGQPCTVPVVHSYTTPGSYGYNCKCQAYAPSGYYNIQCVSLGGCSYYEYGCWWNCQGTSNDFNTASCSDGVQNCGETCVDGGPQCNAGTKETDNSYLVTFDYTQPAGLSNTKLYTDAASWNCADGIDNDRDCLVDCADTDCASSYACTDKTPPVTTLSLSGRQADGWYAGATSATLSCQDDISGCKETYYCTDAANACAPSAKYSGAFNIGSSAFVRFYSNDKANNAEAVKSKEVKIDGTPPAVSVSASPASPCTLNPLASWIDCSATISVSCSDAGSGCKSGSYGYKTYDSNPGACPASKFSYATGSSFVASGRKFACAYAEDIAGNAGVSLPAEIKIDKTFTITVDAKAYGEIEFSAGMKVDAYLCESSQYYCNHDAQYLTKGSALVGEDKKFKITLANVLERGNKYKIGVVTEKGYAESEFVA